MSKPFSEEHLAIIRKAMNDDVAYEVLMGKLGRLASIAEEAQTKRCTRFACRLALDGRYAVHLRFADYDGNRLNASISFGRDYAQATGKPYDMEVGLAFKQAVQSLVLNLEGIEAHRNIRRQRQR